MINCISCNSKSIKFIGKIPDSSFFSGNKLNAPLNSGGLYRCCSCNICFRYPRLKKKEYDNLYINGKEEHWQDKKEDRLDWDVAFSLIGNYKNKKILDIGCFDGRFLHALNFQSNLLYGVEINKVARKKAEDVGVNIISKDYFDLYKTKYMFDVITVFDVIEHTLDPFEFLKIVSESLNEEGLLIIGTGNSDAFSWRFMGAQYWYCTISEHLSFINPKWSVYAAKKAGLELVLFKKISHKKTSFYRKFKELMANLLYKLSPFIYRNLRKKILLDKNNDITLDLNRPPSWLSSKDHFVCVFKKK